MSCGKSKRWDHTLVGIQVDKDITKSCFVLHSQPGPVNPSGEFEMIGFGNFIMTSGKSQCCGGCGYRFSVTCLNQPPQVGRKRRSVSEEYIEERMVSVHFSSKITGHSCITQQLLIWKMYEFSCAKCRCFALFSHSDDCLNFHSMHMQQLHIHDTVHQCQEQ